MKKVLGSKLLGRKVVTTSGLDLGEVMDAYLEEDGRIVSILVRPERVTKQIESRLDKNGLLTIPYTDVKAIGKYVVVNF